MEFKTATLVSKNILAAKFHDLVFQTEGPFEFEAGQFVTIKINDKKMNAYSIAGRVASDKFGLLIDTTPGGLGSQMIEAMQVGDKVQFVGPSGHMTLKDDGAAEIIFMAVSSGVAPVKALLEEALRVRKMTIPMTFYFGLRYCEDVFWGEHFDCLQKEYPNFKFVLTLSKPNEDWSGCGGYITKLLTDEKEDLSQASAYICGSGKMTDQAVEILTSKNCPKERIYFEKYG